MAFNVGTFLGNGFNTIIGGPKTSTTTTTETPTDSTNYPLLIGGIILGLGAVVLVIYLINRSGNKKAEKAAA